MTRSAGSSFSIIFSFTTISCAVSRACTWPRGIFSRSSLMYLTAMWLTLFGGIRSQLFRFIPESTSVNKVEVVRLGGLHGAI
jgi:hypothetical protein